jgi:hypothetical protein
MKINNLDRLPEFGFYKVFKEEHGVEELEIRRSEYMYTLGHSRRGQFYYYLVDKSGYISIYASEPDGGGTSINWDSVIIKLFKEGLLNET